MSENETKKVDPTAFGLFLVAAVSFPLALSFLIGDEDLGFKLEPLALTAGVLIAAVAYLAWKAGSNFGFTVFGLVGAAVFLTGTGGLSFFGDLGFAVLFIITVIWSIMAKTPLTLTLILVFTTLIFLFVALFSWQGDDIYKTLAGVSALLNFLATAYLGLALASEGKIPAI